METRLFFYVKKGKIIRKDFYFKYFSFAKKGKNPSKDLYIKGKTPSKVLYFKGKTPAKISVSKETKLAIIKTRKFQTRPKYFAKLPQKIPAKTNPRKTAKNCIRCPRDLRLSA